MGIMTKRIINLKCHQSKFASLASSHEQGHGRSTLVDVPCCSLFSHSTDLQSSLASSSGNRAVEPSGLVNASARPPRCLAKNSSARPLKSIRLSGRTKP
jgi:hypothetical protein